MGEWISYGAGDKEARAYLALPEQGGGPGVLLGHAWWGLNSFMQELADRLAGEGFVTLAPDLYDGQTADTIEGAEQLGQALDSRYHEAINYETVAVDYLLSHPAVTGQRLGAVAFSLSASYITWLATLKPQLAAVVLFYGGIYGGDVEAEDYPDHTQAAFLGHYAADDPYESPEAIRRMEGILRSAGREVTFHFYEGTGHWFFENDRPDAYSPEAAELAWKRTIEFLHRHLDGQQ